MCVQSLDLIEFAPLCFDATEFLFEVSFYLIRMSVAVVGQQECVDRTSRSC